MPSFRVEKANGLTRNWPGLMPSSAPASNGTITNVPGAASPYTNSISGGQRFFRLISN